MVLLTIYISSIIFCSYPLPIFIAMFTFLLTDFQHVYHFWHAALNIIKCHKHAQYLIRKY